MIVCVEVPGAWGRDVVADSELTAPEEAVLYAIRHPNSHAKSLAKRQVLVAGGFSSVPWLATGVLAPEALTEFLAADVTDEGVWEQFGLSASTDAVVLVCTNGKRDTCCAVRGREIALAAHAAAPGRVWEVSHIGGHRYAPTAIHLPSGQTFGRLSADDGATLAAAGRSGTLPAHLFDSAHHRGRTDLSPAQRVAETWWRTETSAFALLPALPIFDTDVTGPKGVASESHETHVVELPDGRRLTVREHAGPELRDSCDKGPKPSSYYDVGGLTA